MSCICEQASHTAPLRALGFQEYNRYKDRLLKAENQLVNALGFDFMIEHPFGHSNDLVAYLCEEGEARGPRRGLMLASCP